MRVVLCQIKKGLLSFLALSIAPVLLPTSTSSKVSMSYLAGRPFCQCCLSFISGKGGNGPSSSIFCFPTLPQRGIVVVSSVSVAQQWVILRGPVLSIQSWG